MGRRHRKPDHARRSGECPPKLPALPAGFDFFKFDFAERRQLAAVEVLARDAAASAYEHAIASAVLRILDQREVTGRKPILVRDRRGPWLEFPAGSWAGFALAPLVDAASASHPRGADDVATPAAPVALPSAEGAA